MKPKNCSGSPLTRTQKGAGLSDKSMRNHPAWIIKCKVKDFLANWRYAFNILGLIYGFNNIPPIDNKLGPTNMVPMASKTWVLKQ